MDTLLLDRGPWDLCLDARGNIALASDPYSIAQDVASSVRTFLGEVWYDTSIGVPYFQQILGQLPPIELMKAQFVAAALRVPQVLSATCFFTSIKERGLSGQIQFTYSTVTLTGEAVVASNLISFVGDNLEFVTFIGDNGIAVRFEGY